MPSKKLPSNREIWDCIATSFDVTRQRPWTQISVFLDSEQRNGYLIDIGCGNGRHLTVQLQKNWTLIGVDISRNLLSIAQENIKENYTNNISFIQATASNLPFINDSVDRCLYIASLHTLRTKQDRINSLQELCRILKPGAKALISVWNKDQERFKQFFKEKKRLYPFLSDGDIIVYWRQHHHNIPRFYHLYTKQEFIKELTQIGFIIQRFEEVNIASKNSIDNFFATVKKP